MNQPLTPEEDPTIIDGSKIVREFDEDNGLHYAETEDGRYWSLYTEKATNYAEWIEVPAASVLEPEYNPTV